MLIAENGRCYCCFVHQTMIWFILKTYAGVRHVNRPLAATVKRILKNQVQGELVPCQVNFRVAAKEAVIQMPKLLIPSAVRVQSLGSLICG
jgi:hypothetical protein